MPATPYVTTAAAVAWLVVAGSPGQAAQGLSPDLERLLTEGLGFTSSQIRALGRGEPVTAVLPGSIDREIAIAGAVRVEAPAERTVEIVRDIERFESGARFLQRKRLSDPPRLDDFASFRLMPDDLAALRRCRPGRCDVKIDQGAFPAFAGLGWALPDVEARANTLFAERALGYVEAYRARGNRALATYADRERPVVVAEEFEDMVTRATPLGTLVPGLVDVLLKFPGAQPRGTEDLYYWSVSDLGLKPVFRLNHVIMYPTGASAALRYVMATRLLHANHYFNTGLEVRALIDDPARSGRAHVLVTLNVARLDGITGLLGRVAKARVRAVSRDALATALRATKQRAEAVKASEVRLPRSLPGAGMGAQRDSPPRRPWSRVEG